MNPWTTRLLALPILALASSTGAAPAPIDLPWEEAGWSEREAAAHLLDRFAFGARPGDVDRVVELGLEHWLELQLRGDLDDPVLDTTLEEYDALRLTGPEIAERFPNPGLLLRKARDEGRLDPDALAAEPGGEDRGDLRREVRRMMRQEGAEPVFELIRQTWGQKLHRAVLSENQLTEVLVDFWFNHFNVSLTDNQARPWVLAYERDAIRPHVLGDFATMLEETARHPAMLLYLDNARSVADAEASRTFDPSSMRQRGRAGRGGFGRRGRGGDFGTVRRSRQPPTRPGAGNGLNENYARELLELHTLGVDGGYTQEDVVEVARAFTGWTVLPPRGLMQEDTRRQVARVERLRPPGFVLDGSFVFRADAHDADPKTVLGHRLRGGRGMEDGLEVLEILAEHPSTARHLSRKLAARFVRDDPPEALVDRLTATFLRTGGDLTATMRTLAASPEFWDPEVRGAKIKSPFEVAVSAVRALDADVVHPEPLLQWIDRMGQRLYAYQAPTGFPDEAAAWVNTGSLLHRMNFGLQLATGRIPGLDLDIGAQPAGLEPESLVAALEDWFPRLLPERDPGSAIARLTPVVSDPELVSRIEAAAPAAGPDPFTTLGTTGNGPPTRRRDVGRRERPYPPESTGEPGMDRFRQLIAARVPPARPVDSPTTHVVGVILGSPDFQRR